MNKYLIKLLLLVFVALQMTTGFAQEQRFPKPEFETKYEVPSIEMPDSRVVDLPYFNVFLLVFLLALTSWLVIKKRSRKYVSWVSIFSVLYFGFYVGGCVCPVGSLQNVTLALFKADYIIPITTLLFFIIPLVFTLFFGRTFCASVCPLGAIQDVVALKPMQLKAWVQKVFGLVPFIYLAFAVLYAATGTDFIVCRYDPFVGIFRLTGEPLMIFIGITLLIIGVFIARPYCRFFCPYGVLLNWASRFSRRHITITPSECINCNLCENSCPYGAIDKPVEKKENEKKGSAIRRYILIAILLPVMVFVGGYAGASFHENLASVNSKVQLAQKLKEFKGKSVENDIDIVAFRALGKSEETLYAEATAVVDEFYYGGWLLGAFIALIFGLTLVSLTVFRYKTDYTPNKGTCLSCTRCVDYCPVDR